jgi:tripartite-type tricarboxylate transporter receptor subunit TctC
MTLDRKSFVRALGGALIGATLAVMACRAEAQTSSQGWPARTITAISPIGAGNAVDIVGRVILDQMSKQLGVPIIVENRPGGGGLIGFNDVARAKPDGYTVLLGSSTISSGAVLHKALPYDPVKDFAAVVPFGVSPSVLVVAPSKGFNSVAELVAAAKAHPGRSTTPPPASAPPRISRRNDSASPPASTPSTSRSAGPPKRWPRWWRVASTTTFCRSPPAFP